MVVVLPKIALYWLLSTFRDADELPRPSLPCHFGKWQFQALVRRFQHNFLATVKESTLLAWWVVTPVETCTRHHVEADDNPGTPWDITILLP